MRQTFETATRGELERFLALVDKFPPFYLDLMLAWVEGKWEWLPSASNESVLELWESWDFSEWKRLNHAIRNSFS